MSEHKITYMKFFGYDKGDFMACEVCGNRAVDIHHIEARGMGGTKKKYSALELMALCRWCHEKFGDKKQYKDFLNKIHLAFVESFSYM